MTRRGVSEDLFTVSTAPSVSSNRKLQHERSNKRIVGKNSQVTFVTSRFRYVRADAVHNLSGVLACEYGIVAHAVLMGCRLSNAKCYPAKGGSNSRLMSHAR